MENEILFRGKRLGDGKWLYGFYAHIPVGRFDMDEHVIQTIRKNGEIGTLYNVDVSTAGRYTGLTDRNGVKIFEGDIVRYQFDNDDCPFPDKRTDKIIGRIFFSGFRANFSVTAGRNGSDSINSDSFKYVRNGNRVEVIGNIHDNPELLEVQNGAD